MIFQFTSKKIISLLACISITISCLVIPASAVSPGTDIEGIGVIGTLWDIALDSYNIWQDAHPDSDPSEYPGFNPGGAFGERDENGDYSGGSRGDLIDTYEEYVQALQTDLGTTTLLSDGGIRVYFKPTAVVRSSRTTDECALYFTDNVCYGTVVTEALSGKAGMIQLWYDEGVTFPFTCTYICGDDSSFVSSSDVTSCTFDKVSGSGDGSKGTVLYAASSTMMGTEYHRRINVDIRSQGVVVGNFTYSCWVDIYPMEGVPLPTTQNITVNSRPSSIVGDYGIMGDDGSIVKVECGSLVNESENLVYSPTTAGEITYTDCVFDYADRSYNLTLEDGSTMKVVYGDENVTIHEGDTVYNVYYLSSDSGSGGSGSDGGGSGDGSVGDAVSGLLGGLGNILAGLIEGLLKMAAQAVEALGGLIDIFNGLVDMILGFFSGFTGFLGSMFPFLPEETFVILNFGLILLIAAAVIKKLFL